MQVKDIKDEDYVNYKYPSMFISTCYCSWKCCIEQNIDISVCQNNKIASQKNIDVSIEKIFNRYVNNGISKSIVIGGLEPILQFDDIVDFISYFRSNNCDDDIVIYTGYYKEEIEYEINILKQYSNIVIKFGRYIANDTKHYDEILGVELSSKNQYAERIS